jgi:Spy/CpxP family protein refolding chaperone
LQNNFSRLKEQLMKKLSVLAVAAMILAVFTLSNAQAFCCRGTQGNTSSLQDQLSPEQKKQFADLRLDFMKKQESLRSEIAKKKIELMELSNKEKIDDQALEQKRKELYALQDGIRNERRSMTEKLFSLLTPDQKKSFGPFSGEGCGACTQGGCQMGWGCPACGQQSGQLNPPLGASVPPCCAPARKM